MSGLIPRPTASSIIAAARRAGKAGPDRFDVEKVHYVLVRLLGGQMHRRTLRRDRRREHCKQQKRDALLKACHKSFSPHASRLSYPGHIPAEESENRRFQVMKGWQRRSHENRRRLARRMRVAGHALGD